MKKLFVLPGYCVGLGGLLLITYRTLLAVGSEGKAIMVQVNRYGEQYLDLICLVFLWGVCLVGVLSLSSMIKGKSREDFIAERTRAGVGMNPVHSFVVSDSFLDPPTSVEIRDSRKIFRNTDLRYLLNDEDGRGGVFSVSVTVQLPGSKG